jgi:triacylglycerol esterase/lipase EstA (alpha/beta hydrolase family)
MSGTGRFDRAASRATARLLVGLLTLCVALLAAAPAGARSAKPERHPVLFVHGFESAGSNFASQAMRFESNGYAPSWVMELDYDSTLAFRSCAVR